MPAIAVVFCALVLLVVAPPRVEADRPEPISSNDDGGPFPIGAQAIDRFNTSFAAATPTADNNRPKVALIGAPTAEVGRPYLLQIDIDDPDRHDIRSWVINWGDGNVTTGSGMPETQSHTYTTLGLTYGITVQVVDDEGTWTSSELVTANADGIGGGLGIGAGPGVGVGVEGDAGAEVVVGRYDPITGQATTGFPTTNETLGSPDGVAVGPDGLIYVSGRSSSNVVRLNPDNPSLAETFVTAQSGGLRSPNGLTFGPDGHLYVASAGSGQVLRYDGQTGAFVDVVVDSDTLNRPVALLFTSDGSLLVADKNDDNIKRYSAPYVPVSDTVLEAEPDTVPDTVPDTGTVPDGVFAATGAGSEPSALLAGPNGNVLVALSGEQTIAELDATSGALVRTLTSPDPGNPTSLAIGPDGHLWVSYYWQDEVRRFDLVTGQAIETLVSQTSPFEPAGLAFEPTGLAFGPTGLAFTPDLLVTVGDPDGEVTDEPFEPGTRTDVWLDSIQDPSEGVDFVANDGAADGQVDFAIVTESYDAVIGNGEVALVAEGESVADAVIMEVVGSASDAKSRLLDESPILSDTDPAPDEDDAIEFEEVLDGVDLVYSADGDDVEYSFIIAPGADPDEITLDFGGAEALSIKSNGDLLIEAETGPSYISTAPVTYQVVDGKRVVIASAYDIRTDGTVGFTLGAYDLALPVIIDPTFVAVETAGGSYPSGSTIDLPVPAAVTPGDFMIAHVAYNITGITDHLTPPAGWNTVTEVAGNDLVHGVYWRVATASEPSTYGFALTGGSTETAAGSITHYSGVDTFSPIDASATQSNGSGAPVDAPSVTTTVADTTIVALWSVRDDGALTPPIGMDERADANSSSGGSASEETIAAVADAPFSTVGATGVATATVDASSGSIGTLLALTPAAGPAAVVHKGVQSGTTVMANGTSSVTAAIDGVDTTRSFLTYSIRGNNNAPSDIVVTGELTDSTTLTFERVGTTNDVIIEWSVAEFSAGVTVQRGTASLSSSPTNVSITAVPLGRSFPLIGHRTTGSGFGDDDFVRASLSSNTNLRLDANWFTSNTVPWQVVTYDDATVQSGTVAFGAGDSSRTATITSVDTAKAWLTYSTSSEPGTGSNIGQKLVRGVVTDATTVTFDRSSTGQAMDVQWHLIEFTDSTEVQHANAAFGTSTSVVDVTIGAVDRSRAVAVGGERGFGGRSDYITDDNPGHGWFTTKLTGASNLRVERGATGSSADLGWFAIEWVCADSDGDGVTDCYEDANTDADDDPSTNPGPDTDGDTIPNYLDPDDDGDGTPTASENADPNGDGDPRDGLDRDRDGEPDYLDTEAGPSSMPVVSEQKISGASGGLAAGLDDNDAFGSSVASIGDLDGDGLADIAVGALYDDDGGADRGAVHVLFMNPDGTVKAEQKISSTVGGLTGPLENDERFGTSVAGLGDIDGDGTNDIAVGSPYKADGGVLRGAVYVLFLNPNGTVRAEQKISSTAGGVTGPIDDLDMFGRAVAGIGDLNGDGINDLAVGAILDEDGGSSRGAMYVLFLNDDGTVAAEQKISATTGGLGGPIDANDFFGSAIAALGDVDGDGITDLAVSASLDDDGDPNVGAVYVLFMNADGTVRAEQKISATVGGLTGPLQSGSQFGYAVAALGDIDDDGVVDLAIGANFEEEAGVDLGAVYVLRLNADGTVKSEQKIGSTVGGLTGPLDEGDNFGSGVVSLGDLDGDGALNLAVAAPGDGDGGNNRGALYVLDLTSNSCVDDSDGDGVADCHEDANTDADDDPSTNPGPDTDGDTIPNYLDPDDDGDGTPTASENADPNSDGDPRDAKDADRDGQPDWLDRPATGVSTGSVATEQKISSTTGGLTASLDSNDRFGVSTAAIGDIDGDGIADLAVGASMDDDGGNGRGAVHILFLNADGTVKAEQKISSLVGGLTTTIDDGDSFGASVAGVGDLDGDGTNDLAVGAYGDDDGNSAAGAVHILFLNADGTVKAEQKISDIEGGFATTLEGFDFFGAALSGIGDLDGDGTNDLAVGARLDDDGGASRGAVYVLLLNTDGTVKAEQKISDTAGGFTATLEDTNVFGTAVTGVGDLDGDGVVDLVVGAQGDNDGGTARGAVYVVFLNTDGTVKSQQKISDASGGLVAALADSDSFGSAVAGVGDLDDDGVIDLAVGAYLDDDGGDDVGAVYVLFLNTDGTVKAEQKISGTAGGLTATLNNWDRFGWAVTGVGDLDGDSIIGLAVGAYGDDDGGAGHGAVHILDLAPLNTVAQAIADASTATRNRTTSLDPSANDIDGEADAVTVLDVTGPSNGAAVVVPGGTVSYTPNTNYTGADTFDYWAIDAGTGLTNYWGLDGDGTDAVGSADGALTGTTTVIGDFGGALSFDELDDRVTVPNFAYGSDFTLSFEFKLDDNTGSLFQYVYSHGDVNTNDSVNIFFNEASHGTDPNVLRTVVRDADDTLDNTALQTNIGSLVGDGQWHTYAVTASDVDGLTVWIDGVAVASDPTRGTGEVSPAGSAYFGTRHDLLVDRWYGGSLDTVQVYSRALTAGEIVDLNAGVNRNTVSLTVGPCADSDTDGVCDLDEDANTDADDDPSTNPGPDTDGDTIPNYLDPDDDGDGTPTASENADPNGDGDPRDALDSDRDGQPDYLDEPTVAATGTVADEQKISDTVGGLTASLADSDSFGSSVASIGDLDGDGVADVAVGAPADDDGGTDRGAVYVLFLNADGTVKSEQKISDTVGGLAASLVDLDSFGSSVGSIGDLDGDGVNDVVVGAPADDDGGTNRGAVYVLFLNADGTVKAEQKISDTAGGLAAALADADVFGTSAGGLGDVDGDGINDVVVGATGDDGTGTDRGAVYVLFLNADGTVKAEQKIAEDQGGLVATIDDSDDFGISANGLGDLDGDGVEDLAVGASRDDDGGPGRGAVYVLFLNADGTVKAEQKISDVAGGFTATLDNSDFFGTSVAGLGDLDGDGIVDLAVGAPADDAGGSGRGAVYVLFLNADGTVKSEQKISDTDGGLTTTLNDNDWFGNAVAGLGDLDGDGAVGLAVGADGDDDGGSARGAVHIIDLTIDATATVNSTGDSGDANPGDLRCDTGGTNAEGATECTLRAAIEETNAASAKDTIDFDIPVSDTGHSAGIWTISPASAQLDGVTANIDGTTQAGWSSTPVIVLDGSLRSGSSTDDGLAVAADGVTISALSIVNWPDDGTHSSYSGATFTNLWLGVLPDGTTAANQSSDLVLFSAAANTTVDATVMAAAGSGYGLIVNNTTTGTVVNDSWFGTTPTFANLGAAAEGVVVYGSSDLTVTGSTFGFFPNAPIVPSTSGTVTITGSAFGTDLTGAQVLPITETLWSDSSGTIVFGGTGVGDGNIVRNVLNDGFDLAPSFSGTATILGNSIVGTGGLAIDLGIDGVTANDPGDTDTGANGLANFPEITNATGLAGSVTVTFDLDVPVNGDGYRVEFFSNPSGAGVTGYGESEIYLGSTDVAGTGTDYTFNYSGAVGDIITATATQIVGAGFGPTSELSFAMAVNNGTVTVNSTGDGTDAMPGNGLCDTGSTNADGDPECTLRAAITETNASAPLESIVFDIPTGDGGWNAGPGTWTIRPTSPLPTVIAEVTIDGTTQTGFTSNTAATPAALDGLPVIELNGAAAGSSAAGLHAQARTTINGLIINRFEVAGVLFDTGSDGSRLLGSFVGTDHTGLVPLQTGSASVAVDITSGGVVIGGTAAADRNLLSGNQTAVQAATTNASALQIEGNLIGLGADGVTEVANSRGVSLNGLVTATVTNNVIAANTTHGLVLQDTTATVTGNRIGVNSGDGAAGNGGAGVLTTNADGSIIGGTTGAELNTIANNGGDGVSITAGTNLTVIGNAIQSNGGLAIDWLDDGVTANDGPDVDGVPNRPTITELNLAGATATAEFELDIAAGDYRVEFFRNTAADAAGSGEAEILVGATTITHTGSGAETFSYPFAATAGDLISATATRDWGAGSFGPTSELAVTVAVNTPPTFDQDFAVLSAAEGEVVAIAAAATDLDGDTMAWSASGLPTGLSINPASGAISGTVSATGGAASPYAVAVTVADGRGGTDTDTFSWTVTDTNRAPNLSPIADITADELTTITFTAAASDPDLPADTIVYSATNLPSGATINPTTGEFSWTPTEAQGPGSYTITVTATDNGTPSLEDDQTFTISVDEVNTDPVLSALADQVVGEGSTVSVTPSVSDADLPANTLSWTATGLPPGLTISSTSGVISGTVSPTAGAGSPYASTVSVDDNTGGAGGGGGAGGTDSISFTWTVVDTNRNPVLSTMTDVTVTEGGLASFGASATDPDLPADGLTLSATGLPPGASFDPNTGIFSWPTIETDGPSVVVVTVTVTDDGSPPLDASQPVVITVTEQNQAPSIDPLAIVSGDEGSLIAFTPTATDPDVPVNTLTWSATGLPPGASIDPATGEFSWTPTEAQGPDLYTFTITVTDGGSPALFDSQPVTVEVTETNLTPSLAVVADQNSSEGDAITLAPVATDADVPINTLTWSASGLPPGLFIDPASGLVAGTLGFDAADNSPHLATIEVSDEGGATATRSFSWTVAPLNREPTVTVDEAQYQVDEGDRLTITAVAEDPDLDPLTFSLVDPPFGVAIDPGSGVIDWTPDEDQGPATYNFAVAVDDGQATVQTSLTIVVGEVNRPPSVGSPPDQMAIAGKPFTVGLSAADPDLPSNALSFTIIEAPSGMSIDPSSGLLSWTPDPEFSGSVDVEIEVADDGEPALRARTRFTIEVILGKLDVVDTPPVATGDTLYTGYKQTVEVDVLANDLGDDLTLLDVGQVVGGTVEIVGNSIVFAPKEGFAGVATFTYRARQATGGITSATVTVVVAPPELSPIDDVAIAMSGRPIDIEVLANDQFVGQVQTIEVAQPSTGATSVLADRRIRYLPPDTFVGFAGFSYTVADSFGTTRSARVMVSVIEPALPDTTATLTDVDVPETEVAVVAPTTFGFADLSQALINAVATLSIPFRLVAVAGAWATLLVVGLAWIGPRRSVGAITNTARGEHVPVEDPKTGRRVFQFHSGADLIWMGRRRWRRGSWYRKVETPLGSGLVEDQRLCDMNETYLEPELGNEQQ